MSTQMETRTGAIPTAGRWELDPSHTTVEFWARHLGLSKVRGHFTDFKAEIVIGESAEDSSFEATLDASTIDTRFQMRDDHLKSGDFLDIERFKEIRFVSRSVEPAGDHWHVNGDLTIRDITKPVTLEVEYHGEVEDPMMKTRRAGFSGSFEFDREEFDMTWNGAIEIGGFVGKKVHVEIEAEVLLQS